MRIATWNINSVRLRIGLVEKLVQQASPDVIALQETKTPDDKFPYEAIENLGFSPFRANRFRFRLQRRRTLYSDHLV